MRVFSDVNPGPRHLPIPSPQKHQQQKFSGTHLFITTGAHVHYRAEKVKPKKLR